VAAAAMAAPLFVLLNIYACMLGVRHYCMYEFQSLTFQGKQHVLCLCPS